MNTNKDLVGKRGISSLRDKAEVLLKNNALLNSTCLPEDEVTKLLNELQHIPMELKKQNKELKASYDALEVERAKFAGLFDLAPVGYFILDHSGVIDNANHTGISMLHTFRTNVINKKFQNYIAPEAWQTFFNFLFEIQYTKSKNSCEVKLVLDNQENIYARLEGIVIAENQHKNNPHYYITLIDITESKIVAQRLRETKERLEMTLEVSSTGTWGLDMRTKNVFMDDFSFSLFGLKPWEYDGSHDSLLKIIYPEDRKSVRESLKRAINEEKEIDIEFRVKTKEEGINYIAARGHIIKGAEEFQLIAGILMDITDKKKLAQETDYLRLSQQKMVIAATFTAQEKERQRISGALHDSVCQVLYGIKLNLQTIEGSGSSQNQQFKNINQLLDMAIRETRDISFELTPSILHDFGFTVGIKEIARRLSTPDFLIQTKISEQADQFHPDIQLSIFRIIQELVNNTIKHAEATTAEVLVSTEDKKVAIKIADNGKGFDANYDQLMLRGSGLRGIKNRVFLLNGKMTINTQISKGSEIIITFDKNKVISPLEI